MSHHPDHSKELNRLNRIAGQVDGVRKMIEEQRYCTDILTQLRAIRSALHSVEANILEAHLSSCVADALHSGDSTVQEAKIAELKDLYKRFGS